MTYRCSICGVTFAAEGSTIAHVVGSTADEHLGVGYQRAGEFVEPVDGDGDANSTQETRDADAGDSGDDPDDERVETAADGGRSDPMIPTAPGASTSTSTGSSTGSSNDSTPCCENCGDEQLAELDGGIEFVDAHGVSHVTDAGDVQCRACGWVGEPR